MYEKQNIIENFNKYVYDLLNEEYLYEEERYK